MIKTILFQTFVYFKHIVLSLHAFVFGRFRRVVRGLIDIVVVLPISTSLAPMLAHSGSILSCASMRLGYQVPAD